MLEHHEIINISRTGNKLFLQQSMHKRTSKFVFVKLKLGHGYIVYPIVMSLALLSTLSFQVQNTKMTINKFENFKGYINKCGSLCTALN